MRTKAQVMQIQCGPDSGGRCPKTLNGLHLYSSWKGWDANAGKIRKTWTQWVCVWCGVSRKRGRS